MGRIAGRSRRTVLMVGTRKGIWFFTGDPARRGWSLDGPHFLGSIIQHVVLDPRDGKTILAAASAGHLGPTIFQTTNWGKSWVEAKRPPAFPKSPDGQGESVKRIFSLAVGHASQPGVWYAGTAPHGIFRSEDGGITWDGVTGYNEHPMRPKWRGDPAQGPPGDPNAHSILVDPRDPNHLYAAFSPGGVFESDDGGADWRPLNRGVAADFLPEKDPEYGHDPHCLALHPRKPDRLYQQNHCGIYRLDRPDDTWTRIGKNMPSEIGDIGFPIVLHPRDPETVWVFPMDGTTVWPRTSPGGQPAVYMTRDGGATWKRQAVGLPRAQAFYTVKRQAMAADRGEPVGLYFGTSSGELWASRDEGARWRQIAAHLPEIYSVTTGTRR